MPPFQQLVGAGWSWSPEGGGWCAPGMPPEAKPHASSASLHRAPPAHTPACHSTAHACISFSTPHRAPFPPSRARQRFQVSIAPAQRPAVIPPWLPAGVTVSPPSTHSPRPSVYGFVRWVQLSVKAEEPERLVLRAVRLSPITASSLLGCSALSPPLSKLGISIPPAPLRPRFHVSWIEFSFFFVCLASNWPQKITVFVSEPRHRRQRWALPPFTTPDGGTACGLATAAARKSGYVVVLHQIRSLRPLLLN